MKIQPRSVMQAGVMPLHGIGAVSGMPPGASIVMPAGMSPLIGMATAGINCSIDALKNATANRIANSRLKG